MTRRQGASGKPDRATRQSRSQSSLSPPDGASVPCAQMANPWPYHDTATHYREALIAIEGFGYNNPGHGFSCARMASVALGKEPK